jgi:hypothetical protein
MILLFETPAGFALFKVLDEGRLNKVEVLSTLCLVAEKLKENFVRDGFCDLRFMFAFRIMKSLPQEKKYSRWEKFCTFSFVLIYMICVAGLMEGIFQSRDS